MFDSDWRLVYAGTDYTFGSASHDVFNVTAPDLGDVALRTADADRPRSDGVGFGVDFRGSRTIGFDLGVWGSSETAIRSSMGVLARAWRADAVRSVPGAVAELHSLYRGQERVVFGRPRRFAPVLAEARTGLYGAATADFICADDLFYSASENVAQVSISPAGGGGLIAPLASPLATTASSDRSVGMTVSGELPVWPVIEVAGPVVNPTVEVVGVLRLEFALTLAYDQTLVVDTRPWARSMLVNGASAAGAISRTSTRLLAASVPPGRYELALRGVSESGNATARVRWRDAFSTP